MAIKRNFFLDVLGLIISLSFLAYSAKPLFHPGLFPTVDNYAVVRIEEMGKELANRQFPVRYIKDLSKGHGYMFFNFYTPLPYYTGAVLNLLGVNLVGSLKRTFFIALVIGATFMYFLGKKFFGRVGGIVSSGVFSFTPFLGFDLYYRGGLGEVWAMCLIPMILYFFVIYLEKFSFYKLALSSLSISALILSHNVTSYISLPIIFLFMLIINKLKINRRVITPFVYGLAVSSFFWLPALVEKNLVWGWYMTMNTSNFVYNFLQYKMIYSPDFLFKMDFLNPWYALIPLFVSIVYLLRKAKPESFITFSIMIVITCLYLTMPISKPIWEHLKNAISMLQFPWRFLTIYTVLVPIIASSIITGDRKKRYSLAILILSVSLWTSYKSFQPEKYEFVDKYRPEDACGTTFSYEYLPIWTKVCLKQFPNLKFDFFEGNGTIKVLTNKSRYYEFVVNSKENSIIRVNEYFYPGWRVYVDDINTPIIYKNLFGIISFPVKQGTHKVIIKFENTLLRDFGNSLSLISFMILLIIPAVSFAKKHVPIMNKNE